MTVSGETVSTVLENVSIKHVCISFVSQLRGLLTVFPQNLSGHVGLMLGFLFAPHTTFKQDRNTVQMWSLKSTKAKLLSSPFSHKSNNTLFLHIIPCTTLNSSATIVNPTVRAELRTRADPCSPPVETISRA